MTTPKYNLLQRLGTSKNADLYRLSFAEYGERIPSWSISRYFDDDETARKAAQRVIRLMNFWGDVPGGQWPTLTRATIERIGSKVAYFLGDVRYNAKRRRRE